MMTGDLYVCQEWPLRGQDTQKLMSTAGHVTLPGSRDLPSNPQMQRHKLTLRVRGWRLREVKRLPKVTQPTQGWSWT